MKRFGLFALLLVLMGVAHAQLLVVGQLVKDTTKVPVPEVRVDLLRASDNLLLRSTVTDSLGQFSIANDTAVTFLCLHAEGWESIRLKVPATKYGGPTGLGKIDMGGIRMFEAEPPRPIRHCAAGKWWFRKRDRAR